MIEVEAANGAQSIEFDISPETGLVLAAYEDDHDDDDEGEASDDNDDEGEDDDKHLPLRPF
ncbi:hypothetical protein [uncultured Tateyamaria sp.]|uniref:hypothetical protein n=1 Tax=uncultured Tateyamaria sp. TaxID=455651 RepID=UPI002608B377|nr:hypothetical protein [uncultured Tateyamaria sp.]